MEYDICGLYSGVIYDAIMFDIKDSEPFVLRKEVTKSWDFNNVLFGPAFTCYGTRVISEDNIDDTVRLKMFQAFYDGCVQVIASPTYDKVAMFGDISGKLAKKFGAVGAVVDGPIRDVALLKDDEFNIYSDGATPIDAYGKWQIVDYECDVIMNGIDGDVFVRSGDYIYGDDDGVMVIKQEYIDDAIMYARKRADREDVIRKKVGKCVDVLELNDRIGRW